MPGRSKMQSAFPAAVRSANISSFVRDANALVTEREPELKIRVGSRKSEGRRDRASATKTTVSLLLLNIPSRS